MNETITTPTDDRGIAQLTANYIAAEEHVARLEAILDKALDNARDASTQLVNALAEKARAGQRSL